MVLYMVLDVCIVLDININQNSNLKQYLYIHEVIGFRSETPDTTNSYESDVFLYITTY